MTPRPAIYPYSLNSGEVEFSEVGKVLQHSYGAYDPSPVVSSRICLASSTNEAGTSTSLGPADRKSGASKPAARWISDGMPASFSTPSISSATDSSGAAATFTHLSAMHASYPRPFTEAPRSRVIADVTQLDVCSLEYLVLWLDAYVIRADDLWTNVHFTGRISIN